MRVRWDLFSARRRLSLSDFSQGIDTYESLVEKFNVNKIIPPENLEVLFKSLRENKDENQKNSDNKTPVPPKKTRARKSSPAKKAPPAKKQKTSSNSPAKKKYFRKVVKKDE